MRRDFAAVFVSAATRIASFVLPLDASSPPISLGMEQRLLYIILYRNRRIAVDYVNVTDVREDLLNIVKNGKQIAITRNGKPTAVILSFHEYQQLAALRDATRDPDEFLAAVSAHRAVQRGTRIIGSPEDEIADRLTQMERTILERAVGIENHIKKLQSSVQRIDERVNSKATA
jgi:prevent-host-death family protein